ncbi:MAG: hypothetical protein Q9210_001069, partial [Variospora velana]
IHDIQIHRRDNGHDGESHQCQPRGREHPVHLRGTGPAVPEQSAGEPDRAGGDAEGEARLRDRDPVITGCGARVVGVLGQAGEGAEGFADEERELDYAARRGGEVVGGGVDEGDALRHQKYQAEAEGGPEGEGEDDGFGDEEVGGSFVRQER